MLTTQEAKDYLKADDDDAVIEGLVIAADSYVRNAVGAHYDGNTELSKLANKILLTHWYENRELVGKSDNLAHSFDAIITQLKYCRSVVP